MTLKGIYIYLFIPYGNIQLLPNQQPINNLPARVAAVEPWRGCVAYVLTPCDLWGANAASLALDSCYDPKLAVAW
jgi:hypothetical protein